MCQAKIVEFKSFFIKIIQQLNSNANEKGRQTKKKKDPHDHWQRRIYSVEIMSTICIPFKLA